MPKKHVSKLSFMKPDSNKVQAWYAKNKPYINTALDFVPVVGAVNRAVQGNYGLAAANLALDALGPVKWGAKSFKILKGAGNARRFKLANSLGKSNAKVKALEESVEKLNSSTTNFLTDSYKSAAKRLSNNINKAYRQNNSIRALRKVYSPKGMIGKYVIGKTLLNKPDLAYRFIPKDFRMAVASSFGRAGNELESVLNGSLEPSIYFKNIYNDIANYEKYYYPDPGITHLLTDKEQEDAMKTFGYRKVYDDDGIKKINKAVQGLLRDTGRRKLNMYQRGSDVISRDSIYPVDETEFLRNKRDSIYAGSPGDLLHAGSHPTIFYKHKTKPIYYYRDIDLNDYGLHQESSEGAKYGNVGNVIANIYDYLGNPFIQRSGIRYLGSYKYGGKIHIKKKNRGKFTKSAKAAGEGVQEHAHKVMNDPNATTLQKRRANFAIQAKKWNHSKKHSEGGILNYLNFFK